MAGKLKHSHEWDRRWNSDLQVTLAPGSDVSVGVDLRKDSVTPLSVSGDVRLAYPGRELRLFKDVEEPSPGVYQTNTIVQWQTDKQIRYELVNI